MSITAVLFDLEGADGSHLLQGGFEEPKIWLDGQI